MLEYKGYLGTVEADDGFLSDGSVVFAT